MQIKHMYTIPEVQPGGQGSKEKPWMTHELYIKRFEQVVYKALGDKSYVYE